MSERKLCPVCGKRLTFSPEDGCWTCENPACCIESNKIWLTPDDLALASATYRARLLDEPVVVAARFVMNCECAMCPDKKDDGCEMCDTGELSAQFYKLDHEAGV